MYIIGNEETEAVRRVIESKQLFRYRGGEGGETDQFEAEWAAKIGVKHAVAVTSGTAALMCGLVGLGLGPGDEVIVPAYTWMATAMAPLSVGAVPVIAEVDASLMLDANDVERKIGPRTKAIIPVHMSGLPCDMDPIMAVARRHGLLVLEDACQSPGGSYKGRRLGSMGDAGAFSFNHFKLITCGEGGAVVTNNQTVHDRALIYHDVGAAFREHAGAMSVPIFAGLNFRMNEILSAILRVQVGRLEGILESLRREKAALREALAPVNAFTLSPVNDVEGDCGATFGILFETAEEAVRFVAHLDTEGIRANCAINSDRHVYTNWLPILERRGAHHPGMDPLQRADCAVEYSKDMCPRSLDYLARTVNLFAAVDRSPEDFKKLVNAIKRAAD
jgi:dTDP-4-amino-4,6-dideoxygalactose transaminase